MLPTGILIPTSGAGIRNPAAYRPRRDDHRSERGKSVRLAPRPALTPKLKLFSIRAYANDYAAKPNLRQKASLVA